MSKFGIVLLGVFSGIAYGVACFFAQSNEIVGDVLLILPFVILGISLYKRKWRRFVVSAVISYTALSVVFWGLLLLIGWGLEKGYVPFPPQP